MTNLTSPAAEAASGFPNTDMPDVIDSLKRLERVGSENSKTTQKLISAAGELSSRIVQHIGGCLDGQIVVSAHREIEAGKLHYTTPWTHNYSVQGGNLCFLDEQATNTWKYVAANREAALAFSKDVASGLLDAIVQRLEALYNEAEIAIPPLEKK